MHDDDEYDISTISNRRSLASGDISHPSVPPLPPVPPPSCNKEVNDNGSTGSCSAPALVSVVGEEETFTNNNSNSSSNMNMTTNDEAAEVVGVVAQCPNNNNVARHLQ